MAIVSEGIGRLGSESSLPLRFEDAQAPVFVPEGLTRTVPEIKSPFLLADRASQRPWSFGCATAGLLVSVQLTHGAGITYRHFRYRRCPAPLHFV